MEYNRKLNRAEYIKFLKTLTTADHAWVTLEPANKNYGKWKPFYYL
ncbi:MAG: hypothetical protein WCH01_12265 [Methylococcaceae bacterium]